MIRPLAPLLAVFAFAAAIGTASPGFAAEAAPAPAAGKASDGKPNLSPEARAFLASWRGQPAAERKKALEEMAAQVKALPPQAPKELAEVLTGFHGHLAGLCGTLDALDAAKAAKDDAKAAALEGKLLEQTAACGTFMEESRKKMEKIMDGQRPKALALGADAPALDATVVSGEAVSLKFADHPGKPVVVEFWATWCGPCRDSIPHIDALWEKHKDKAVFVGITRENAQEVKQFVAGQKAMRYPVAVDAGKTSPAYGVSGIPHAFIVVDGKVVWEGHPMAGLDQALEKAIGGKDKK